MLPLAHIEIVMGVRHRPRLHRRIALLAQLAGRFGVAGDIAAVTFDLHFSGADMGVDADPVTHLAPKQRPDRLAQFFALDVPAGLFDRADGGEADHPEWPE